MQEHARGTFVLGLLDSDASQRPMKVDLGSCDRLLAGRRGVDASGWIGQASEAVIIRRVKVRGFLPFSVATATTRKGWDTLRLRQVSGEAPGY